MPRKIKIGDLVKIKTNSISGFNFPDYCNKFRDFEGFVGIVITRNDDDNIVKIFWCSLELRQKDAISWWSGNAGNEILPVYLEVV